MAKADLTVARLRELLNYNPETGGFTWRVTASNRKIAGSPAGGISKQIGYHRIRLDGRHYLSHRLAWLYVNGAWPTEFIDHINGNRNDNRLSNLREATSSINNQNKRQGIKPGRLLGTVWVPLRGHWIARIKKAGRLHHLGSFPTEEAAHAAYVDAKRRLHEGCTI